MNWLLLRIGWELIRLNEHFLRLIRSPLKGPIGSIIRKIQDDLDEMDL